MIETIGVAPMPKDLPPPELLRKLLRYEPETGRLFWRERHPDMFPEGNQGREALAAMWNNKFAGKQSFTSDDANGYKQSTIFNRRFKAHRVIWAMENDEWPGNGIDHINGDPSDNRIANLRDVTHAENMRNMKRPITNTSGIIGVSWNKNAGKWMAFIGHGKNRKYLGVHETISQATAARNSAEVEMGYHENHGR